MNIKGIISDLDDTLAQTQALHFKAWENTAEKFGVKINLNNKIDLNKFWGLRDIDFLKGFAKEKNISLDQNQITYILSVKNEEYKKLVLSLKPDYCTLYLINIINKYKLKFAIVTSSMRNDALAVLNRLNIRYDLLITSDEVKNVKPDPEPVNLAINGLNLSSNEIIAVGDSIFDAISYKKAGLSKIFLLNIDYEDTIKISSLCELSDIISKEMTS
ncbi:putative phosphatase/phosphohexomutase [Caldisphaera lagunensis DSM 15908]|uniref:Putative phosphatase/phosphohexomutase n=1 Tax=Caldisphaera lagunensis (strain DSM 15908 / JCM 11604 / ANMR 0165 / IC-154) TaxID=1056495 RepID=L0A9N5_CALLD|nr:HAD hydrolase-like protein [Caldisphaera lagunensis]AFZ70114.1 putative phosphatase/phosphohexomutase [Caldisphaera lagunensis DSM 15908]